MITNLKPALLLSTFIIILLMGILIFSLIPGESEALIYEKSKLVELPTPKISNQIKYRGKISRLKEPKEKISFSLIGENNEILIYLDSKDNKLELFDGQKVGLNGTNTSKSINGIKVLLVTEIIIE